MDDEAREEEHTAGGSYRLLTPGLDNTCLFMSLTAGAGTRCMSLLSSSPNLFTSDIPFPWFLMLGCNSQAQDLFFLAFGWIQQMERLFSICPVHALSNSLSLYLMFLSFLIINPFFFIFISKTIFFLHLFNGCL